MKYIYARKTEIVSYLYNTAARLNAKQHVGVTNLYINERHICLNPNFDNMELENNFGKGVEKFESGVAKVRDKIDSIGEQTKEQYQNWKRVLSGALNDKQLIIALTVMFGFYLFFSGFNTILGGNAREENTMTCACPVGHSAYYRTLLVVTIAAWVVCFVLTTIWDTVKFWRYAIGKRSSLHHQTSLASIDIESAKDRAPSMLEQTIGSVEKGVQAASKIPVKSIFTKAMGIVKDTLDMVDEGAKTLHKIDSGLKEVKENPLESVLNKSMEVVDNVITHRLESSDENAPKVSKQNPTVTETMTPLNHGSLTHGGSLLSTATGMVGSRTEQIPENATITKPIGFAEDDDNKMLTKSAARSRLATNVLSNQCPTESPTTTQTNGGSVLTNAVKVTKAKKSHSKKSLQCTRQLTEADTNALQRLKHYENYLWLQFYKVYSVGATLHDQDQALPAFIHVLGGDHEEPADGYETSADDHDEFKPIIEEKKPRYPETELVEVESSYNDVDGDEIPAIVIESDENHDTKENHNADEVPIVIIESNMSGKISDTISGCDDTENNDSAAAENDEQTTYSHDINLRATNQDDKDLTSDLIPAMDHPLKLTQSNSSMLSVKSNSTPPNSSLAQSTATLSSVKSTSTDEDDFLASWVSFKPVGLYNEPVDEENVVMVIADATCARVSFFLYPVLVLSRLLSQLLLVPLLLFQILDTYAWICISGDIYCSSILNQYRLGLDKAALAFTFYCCLLGSILATAILRWFPCSKYARKAGATCIM